MDFGSFYWIVVDSGGLFVGFGVFLIGFYRFSNISAGFWWIVMDSNGFCMDFARFFVGFSGFWRMFYGFCWISPDSASLLDLKWILMDCCCILVGFN